MYAIRDPLYLIGYTQEFGVCYPCSTSGDDPVACECIMEGKGLNDVTEYPWRDKAEYSPSLDDSRSIPARVMKATADMVSSQWANSNSFAKYFIHLCTKRGLRPKKPLLAEGWEWEFGGKGPDYPPPWGGVSKATGERYE